MDLAAGRLDAIVVDEVVGRYLISKRAGEYRVLDENFGTGTTGSACARMTPTCWPSWTRPWAR